MPNWCLTDYAIFSANGKDLDEVCSFMADALKTPNEKLDPAYKNAGSGWLGKMLLAAGIMPDGIPCRGFASYVDTETSPSGEKYIVLSVEDAWAPHPEALQALFESDKFKNYDLYFEYMAEEPGCGVYVNTDTSHGVFPVKWKLFIQKDEEYIEEYFDYDCENELVSFFNETCGKSFKSLDEIKSYCDYSAAFTSAMYWKGLEEKERQNGNKERALDAKKTFKMKLQEAFGYYRLLYPSASEEQMSLDENLSVYFYEYLPE